MISIIVPIYNVERFLRNCVDSILKQTYRNIELILVDDGSPDDCPTICDYYASQDNRVKVIHQNNKGLSSARNAGLKIAKGEYISFIDGDDFIHDNYFEIMYKEIIETKSDISICLYCREEKMLSDELVDNMTTMDSCQFENYYLNNTGGRVVTNKLFKSSVFKAISFPIGKMHEDEFIIHHIGNVVNKVVLIPMYLYYYRQNNESIVSTGNGSYLFEINFAEALFDRLTFAISNDKVRLVNDTTVPLIKALHKASCLVTNAEEYNYKKTIDDVKKLFASKKYRKILNQKMRLITRVFLINISICFFLMK